MDFASSIRAALIPSYSPNDLYKKLDGIIEKKEIALVRKSRKNVALLLPIEAYEELECLIEILRKTKEIHQILSGLQKGRTEFFTTPEFDKALKRAGLYIERLRIEWLSKQSELMQSSLDSPRLPLKKN